MNRRGKAVKLAIALGLCSYTPTADAITYRSAFMTSWSGCECSASGLSYTDDQISIFNSHMGSKGHSNYSTWSNGDVYGSDYGEDRDYDGEDMYFSDDVEAYAFSGHGSAPTDNGWQSYTFPVCNKGLSTFAGDCDVDASAFMRLGEQSPTYFSSPYGGANRWLLMATCYSVDTDPNEQWFETMLEGTEYVMGYRGLSADSESTDEVLGDWVDNAYSPSAAISFKSSWFEAIEDFWINDTGAVISAGTSSSDAATRRDNYTRNTTRRGGSTWWDWHSWSWHQG